MKQWLFVWIVACAWACSDGANSTTATPDTAADGSTVEDTSAVDTPTPEDTSIPEDTQAVDVTTPPDTAPDVPVDPTDAVDTSAPPDPDPSADDDGDGLTNAEEAQIGTDPQKVDTDGDTYSDYDEVYEGKDPLDENSRIYIGYWPYNANKDAIVDPGWDSEPANGMVIARYQALDQFGDMVDLYDFAAAGVPIVIDVATWFCKPCKALAHYFATGDSTELDEEYAWWNSTYAPVKDLIDSGQLVWITVLYTKGNVPVGEEDVAEWDEAFPHEHIPVLADTNLQLQDYLKVVAMPHLDLLDSNMVFLIYETKGPTSVMKELATW